MRRFLLVLTLLATGCCAHNGSSPFGSEGGGKVVVASADFAENRLLASVYAQALQAKKIKVDLKAGIGSREVLFAQIQSGALTVMPEYNGALLAYLAKRAGTQDFSVTTDQTDRDIARLLPPALQILQPAPAQDNDSLTVTKEMADRYHLVSIPDAVRYGADWVMGAPSTFQDRFQERLKTTYGMRFKEWRSFGASTVIAQRLKQGTIQAADLFTTDPAVQINRFVGLTDPKGMFGVQNIVPLAYRAGLSPVAAGILDQLSAKLTTQDLLTMMRRVAIDKDDYSDVADDWLRRNGLS